MYPTFKRRILATDLDNTIVSAEVPHKALWDTVSLQHTSLIYITGRHKESALSLIEKEQLPKPEMLICDVGASIYIGPDYTLDEEWAKTNERADFETVKQLAEELKMQPQPIDTDWRLAFYADANQVEALQEEIDEANLAVETIYSSERDLDIMPKNVDKGAALEYVLHEVGYNGKVVVAGDSENDVSLFELGLPAIAVGNACETIRNMGDEPHIYVASQPASAGVKEIWTQLLK